MALDILPCGLRRLLYGRRRLAEQRRGRDVQPVIVQLLLVVPGRIEVPCPVASSPSRVNVIVVVAVPAAAASVASAAASAASAGLLVLGVVATVRSE